MNDQLELAIRLGIDEAVEEQNAIAECAKLLFDGQPELRFTLEMTCWQVANAWYDMHEKGEEWEARYKDDIAACHAELKRLGPRDRKGRAPVNSKLERLGNLSAIGRSLCEQAYQSAIDELDEKVHAQWERFEDFDEEFAHDDFWQSVSDEHYHELTGYWTVQDAADVAITAATAGEDVSESEAFRKAYLRARKRETGKVRMTSSEYHFGAGLVRRCCAFEGETFYNLDGKPEKATKGIAA